MTDRIDLHVHTSASDGSDSSGAVIKLAEEAGLKAVAITDHDTTDGIPSSDFSGIEVIPGIEFSTRFRSKVHILGYYIDVDNASLKKHLKDITDDRDFRNEKVAALMRSDGININYDSMKERFGKIVGRPHFAEILIENGIVSTVSEAFSQYLDMGNKYWVKRTTLPLEDCIKAITDAGGTAVIAHPFEYQYEKNSLSELIEECMKFGVTGIECRHSNHTPGQMAYLERIAEDYGLLKTGGSDYHGDIKPDIRIGCGRGLVSVPYSWLETMKGGRLL